MNSSMKTSLGKLLADALRYYYFDRYQAIYLKDLAKIILLLMCLLKFNFFCEFYMQ